MHEKYTNGLLFYQFGEHKSVERWKVQTKEKQKRKKPEKWNKELTNKELKLEPDRLSVGICM